MYINIFSNQSLLESIDYLFYFIQMKMTMLKDSKLVNIIYQKELLIIIISSLTEKTFMISQFILIYNDMRKLEKLTTGQSEDYTTGYMLVYDHCKLIAVLSSGQKELDADPKAIQQIELVGQLKKLDANNNDEFYVCLNNFRKN